MFSRDRTRRKTRRPGHPRSGATRATRRPRSNRRGAGFQWPMKSLLAGTATVAMLAGGGYVALNDMNTARADDLGCYEQAEPQAQTVALIDSSEPRFDPTQHRDLMTAFADLIQNGLTFNERFTLITTDADRIGSVPNPVMSRCAPAQSAMDLERVGAGRASEAFIERQAADAFEEEFLPHLENVFAVNPRDAQRQRSESPVLEQIQGISRMRAFSDGTGPKRLIIVSDLLQNTHDAQFCHTQGHLPSFETFRTRPYYERIAPRSLGGTDVTIYLLIRGVLGEAPHPYCTEEELVRFWRAYFVDAGAGSVDIIRLRRGTASGQ